MKNMIIASSSTIHGSGYLDYIKPELSELFSDVNEILFIPYARPSGISYDAYTDIAREGFKSLNIRIVGVHTFSNAVEAVSKAQAVFVGGGNTFVLVDELYKNDIIDVLRNKIDLGMPYLGTSAGSNICGVSMRTTNDMPVVQPKSYNTLGAIPFNINAHFIEADPKSTHKGETRETRIKEFHAYNNTSVLGLKEGSWLRVLDSRIVLKGKLTASLFVKEVEVQICRPETDFSLLK